MANNGERRDRATYVTEEIRVHGEAEAARLWNKENKKNGEANTIDSQGRRKIKRRKKKNR